MLEGKVAVVSGAGPNIGREIAGTLASSGANVVCLDVRGETAEATAREVVDRGHDAIAVEGDITRPEDMDNLVAQALSAYGHIDILVNNAAITNSAGLLDESLETFRRVVDVILTGTFNCTQHMAKQMVRQGSGGAIVNIASTSGHRGKSGAIAYQSAKAAILNFTRACAVELAPHNIRVNSVTPFQTGMPVGRKPMRDDGQPPKSVPRGRWGKPKDQAQAVLFLVSDNADFITGVDLPVDGGNLAMRISD
ncbi:MAG: SDR family oxidoreductase [Gammaproteobacteria bacterium]|nr:SDR family oxidoreductase [Gammaproteobacteria bacterium]